MKKISLISGLLFSIQINAQTSPSAHTPLPAGGANSDQYWSRSGNTQQDGHNILGTRWNSPIYFYTAGVTANSLRMKLNGDLFGIPQFPINNYNLLGNGPNQINTTGYLGLGYSGNGQGGNLWADQGPWSLLHLNGREGTFVLESGYRPWMKAGITITENQDAMYIGTRVISNDVTESLITWSDNAGGTSSVGPDDFVFRFTSNSNGSTTQSGNVNTSTDIDGRHIMRMTGDGDMGVGATFGLAALGYVQPQSIVHASKSGSQETFYQATNQAAGETADDGLRLGLRNYAGSIKGLLRWQEETPFVIQTDFDNTPGFANNDGERLRISSINAPGVPNPANYANNTTRVAISTLGNQPITEPRALLHMGSNTSAFGAGDGWRDWMNVGTFTNDDSDNMYVGLKDEGTDRKDAIVNWGDNQVPGAFGPNGPDNLRFVFTSTTTATPPGQGDPISQSQDGLEVARMDPRLASTLPVNDHYGMVGIGNFSINGPNTAPADEIDAKLDIDGDLRIRHVTVGDSTMLVMLIDTADHGRVHYLDLDSLMLSGLDSIGANNGCSLDPLNDSVIMVQWGHEHLSGSNLANLLNDREIPMDNFDVHFLGTGSNNNNLVSFGQEVVNTPGAFEGKVFSYNDHEQNAFGGFTDASLVTSYGPNARLAGVDGAIIRGNTEFAAGVHGSARLCTGIGTGVYGEARNNPFNVGVRGEAFDNSASDNRGGTFNAIGASNTNYGIFASASGPAGSTNYSGFFTGNIFANGVVLPSDQNLKQNVQDLTNATSILVQLSPKTFTFDQSTYPQMDLPSNTRMGLIAQEVDSILPDLVEDAVFPALYDSLGNQTSTAVNFKTLKYEEFIPLLIAGMKEQQATLNSQDSLIGDLQTQINQLYTMMMACCENNSAMQLNGEGGSDIAPQGHVTNVELKDVKSIVLEQNVPNPFAEQTTINYQLPEEVKRAQMLFYNVEGKLINSLDLDQRGAGQLNVFASDLSTGIYTYTLVADGQVIDTKRMVKR